MVDNFLNAAPGWILGIATAAAVSFVGMQVNTAKIDQRLQTLEVQTREIASKAEVSAVREEMRGRTTAVMNRIETMDSKIDSIYVILINGKQKRDD